MPHTFENVTFSDIRMLHEKAISSGESTRKLLPISSPKNCEYHSTPASAQNSTLFTKMPPGTEK